MFGVDVVVVGSLMMIVDVVIVVVAAAVAFELFRRSYPLYIYGVVVSLTTRVTH